MLKKEKTKLFELGRLDIVDLYDWHVTKKLNNQAYFQRQYVWKLEDKLELIDSIMNDIPIPAIFLSEAITDYDEVKKKYNLLDGQQRMTSIFEFIENKFKYNNKTFGEMTKEDKDQILNFSIPIVQIYISPTEVEKIKEIFKRLNKNKYQLNKIEIKSSQFVEYDFITISKIICDTLKIENIDDYTKELDELFNVNQFDKSSLEESEEDNNEILIEEEKEIISTDIKNICSSKKINFITKLYTHKKIFKEYFIRRQVNLQHFINLFGSILNKEIIGRNLTDKKIIEFSEISKEELEIVLIRLNMASKKLFELYKMSSLDNFWINKTNLYSLLYYFYINIEVINLMDTTSILEKLNSFYAEESDLKKEYIRWVQERVNDKPSRIKRNEILGFIFTKNK